MIQTELILIQCSEMFPTLRSNSYAVTKCHKDYVVA